MSQNKYFFKNYITELKKILTKEKTKLFKKKLTIILSYTDIMNETFAIALFDFEAKSLKQLSIKAGESIKVKPYSKNWLYAYFNSSSQGIVPKSFVRNILIPAHNVSIPAQNVSIPALNFSIPALNTSISALNVSINEA